MRVVTASEANQNFSKLLGEAENGEEVVITKRGRPAVRMVAASDDVERQRRIDAFWANVEKNRKHDHKIARGWTRESLYDRDDRTSEG